MVAVVGRALPHVAETHHASWRPSGPSGKGLHAAASEGSWTNIIMVALCRFFGFAVGQFLLFLAGLSAGFRAGVVVACFRSWFWFFAGRLNDCWLGWSWGGGWWCWSARWGCFGVIAGAWTGRTACSGSTVVFETWKMRKKLVQRKNPSDLRVLSENIIVLLHEEDIWLIPIGAPLMRMIEYRLFNPFCFCLGRINYSLLFIQRWNWTITRINTLLDNNCQMFYACMWNVLSSCYKCGRPRYMLPKKTPKKIFRGILPASFFMVSGFFIFYFLFFYLLGHQWVVSFEPCWNSGKERALLLRELQVRQWLSVWFGAPLLGVHKRWKTRWLGETSVRWLRKLWDLEKTEVFDFVDNERTH